ncbi:Crp/Fnr family transcriptional regulator [Bryobacter aggregatus]|uniref:Crp/Fnr family transcriptional regulator n=1 Tax=Bryobacter aggregatus TaxID=360054 RepID=UPI0004E1DCA8|nr:Crp/Fnr family transcriptional regulator [Bryobacter aggregatus]
MEERSTVIDSQDPNLPEELFPGQEDLLAHLPRSHSESFPSGSIIYDAHSPPPRLYVLEAGRIALSRVEGSSVLISRICCEEDFFGEQLLANLSGERAEALDRVRVMSWPLPVVFRLLNSNPKFGIGLIQDSVRRSMELKTRILDMANRSIRSRIAIALLDFASNEKMMVERPGRIDCIPHRLLARYVGTSREIITHSLNFFRRQQLITYSRKFMDIDINALRAYLHSEEHRERHVDHQEVA